MLYPKIEPYHHFLFTVSDLHSIYVEQCGNPEGIPVLFVHGGPGSGCAESYRQYFNPNKYHVILVDQRGCGRSKPFGCVEENNTDALIADFEQLREHLKLDQWMLFGGSWGSTLSLAYAQAHPDRITGMILRGIFLGREEDIAWLYSRNGAAKVHPDLYEKLISVAPDVSDYRELLKAYYDGLLGDDQKLHQHLGNLWVEYETGMAYHVYNRQAVESDLNTPHSYAFALLEVHYMLNQLFLTENQLIDNIDRIQHIPTVLVHGRYDMVCAVENAWTLKQHMPHAELVIVPDGGHTQGEAPLIKALVEATDRFTF